MDKGISKLLYTFILILLIIFPFLLITSFHGWGDDWALYLAQGKSIAENEYSSFLDYNKFNVENSIFKSAIAAPWGYPLLVSIVFKFFGNNYLFFKIQQVIFIFIFYICLFIGFKNKLNLISRLILIALFGLNIFFISPLNEPLSDYAYLTFSIISVFGIFNIFEKKDYVFNKYIDIILLSILICFTQSIRGIGVSLFITIFIIQIKSILTINVNKKLSIKKSFLFENIFYYFIPYFIKVFYDLLLNKILPSDNNFNFHLSEFSITNINIFVGNIFYYLKLPAYFFSNYAKIGIIFYFACFYPFILGVREKFKKEISFKVYISLNILILLFFPHRQGLRFIYPILPLLFYYVFVGLNILYKNISHNSNSYKKVYKILMIALLFNWSLSFYFYKVSLYDNKINSPFSSYFLESIENIKLVTNNEDKILFWKPRLLKYLTGRDSFNGFEVEQIYKSDYFLHKKNFSNSIDLLNKLKEIEEINLIPSSDNKDFTLFKVLIDRS
tara:strand:- start:2834 stop:4333 length:1500 start_codon:yes stop_codon:yes gene_type:complete